MGKFAEKILGKETSDLTLPIAIFSIILAIILYVVDYTTLWNGYPVQTLATGWKVLASVMAIIFIILFITNHFKITNIKGKFFLWSLWGFMLVGGLISNNFVSFLHAAFSGLFFLMFRTVYKNDPEGVEELSKIIFILTFLDFFGWAAIRSGSILIGIQSAAVFSRLMIPIWIYYVLGFCQNHNGSPFISWIFIGFIIFNLFMIIDMGQLTILQRTDSLDKSIANQAGKAMERSWEFLSKDMWVNIGNSFYEVGQLFNMSRWDGEEEQTEDPQGLTLEALDQGDRPFRTGNKVYATSMLEARTLEDPIEAYVICYTETEDAFGEDTIIYGKINGKSDPVKFTIISYSQHTVRCSFDTLPPGDFDIVFNASFDFASEIRKKIYLMDRQRLMNDQISLENKGKDSSSENVLRELYHIEDTDPDAIYTTGPVELGLGTDNLPIDIGHGEIRESQYSVSVENDWSKGGKIAKFNNIYLKIPDTFSFVEDSCDLEITSTNEQSEEGYNTYKLIMEDRFTNIDDLIGISCIMQIGSNSLDSAPHTVRYLKAYVEYTYVMQEEVSVDVEEGPTADEGLNIRNDLCCEVEYSTETNYYWVVDEEECENYADTAKGSKIASSEMCNNEN